MASSLKGSIPIHEATQSQIAERLQALRGMFENPMPDAHLARFLIARQYHLENTKEMINKALVFRKEHGIDRIPPPNGTTVPYLLSVRKIKHIADANADPNHASFRDDFKQFYPFIGGSGIHGLDKRGCPIYIERAGKFDIKKLAETCSPEALRDFHIRNREFIFNQVMDGCLMEDGLPVEKTTVIVDCSGMGLSQFHVPGISLLKVMSEINATLYPERLGRLFVVNAPIFFSAAWAIIRVWLDERVIDKIQILGSNYKKVLLESVDHDQLPAFLGGSCTCSHMAGGCVPSPKESIPAKPDGYRYSTTLKKDQDPHHHQIKLNKPGKIHYKFKSSMNCKIEIYNNSGNTVIHTHEHCESSGVVEVEAGAYLAKWVPMVGKKIQLEYTIETSHDVSSPADSGKDLCEEEYYLQH